MAERTLKGGRPDLVGKSSPNLGPIVTQTRPAVAIVVP
jgi:hypothetical protein